MRFYVRTLAPAVNEALTRCRRAAGFGHHNRSRFLKDVLNASRQSQSSRICNRFRPDEKHRKENGRQILSDLLITLFNTSLVPP
jgi:hypothetical protein